MPIRSELLIGADVERVWALTVDVDGWPALTPTMTSVERLDSGPLAVGSTARVVQPRQRPATWTVTRLDEGSLFEWKTTVAGVTVAARHELAGTADGCRNTLVVELSGFGSRLLRWAAGSHVQRAIETENAGFKRAAEAG
jgi:hypothetical protein